MNTRPFCGPGRATKVLLLALMAGPRISAAFAHETPAVEAAPGKSRSGLPTYPISLIEGSQDAWSVSSTDAGCYLLSPRRKNSSRLALGHNPVFGLGLFAVNFALATPGRDAAEPIVINVDGGAFRKEGRMVGANLLFVPLAPNELAAVMQTLDAAGTLWLEIHGGALAHAGQDVRGAVSKFQSQCVPEKGAPTGAKSATPP